VLRDELTYASSSHGRDHKLNVWKIGAAEEEGMSTALPLEETLEPRSQPWLLHMLPVNTMNFCSFAACSGSASKDGMDIDAAAEILLAVPNTLVSEAVCHEPDLLCS
jgi:ASTRA-associated protein 1